MALERVSRDGSEYYQCTAKNCNKSVTLSADGGVLEVQRKNAPQGHKAACRRCDEREQEEHVLGLEVFEEVIDPVNVDKSIERIITEHSVCGHYLMI